MSRLAYGLTTYPLTYTASNIGVTLKSGLLRIIEIRKFGYSLLFVIQFHSNYRRI